MELKSQETKAVTVNISKDEMKYWDVELGRFVLEDGEYEVQVCKNSNEVVLSQKEYIKGEKASQNPQEIYEKLEFD